MSLQGKRNMYTCKKCRQSFVTIDRDEGVTPFMTSCKARGCKGHAESAFYQVDQTLVPTHEWYLPDQREIRDIIKPAVLQHVAMGGLLLRPILEEKNYEVS